MFVKKKTERREMKAVTEGDVGVCCSSLVPKFVAYFVCLASVLLASLCPSCVLTTFVMIFMPYASGNEVKDDLNNYEEFLDASRFLSTFGLLATEFSRAD